MKSMRGLSGLVNSFPSFGTEPTLDVLGGILGELTYGGDSMLPEYFNG